MPTEAARQAQGNQSPAAESSAVAYVT